MLEPNSPIDPAYQDQIDVRAEFGVARLGIAANVMWHKDPRTLLFHLARYKFVSKLLFGKRRVLEVGCGDAFFTRIVQQEVDSVTAIDCEREFIEDIQARMSPAWPIDCRQYDILDGPISGPFDAAYSLDVLEHIELVDEKRFIGNMCASVDGPGLVIIGTPSLNSQVYASASSKLGHINCKSPEQLRTLMGEFCDEVLMFGMNDEVVHTGFLEMAHYLWAIGLSRS